MADRTPYGVYLKAAISFYVRAYVFMAIYGNAKCVKNLL